MSRRITRTFLERRFALVAKTLGWENKGAMTVNSVYLEKAPMGAYWRICRVVNDKGGVRSMSDTYSTREMVAYLDALFDRDNLRHTAV